MEKFTQQDLIDELEEIFPIVPARLEGQGITIQEERDRLFQRTGKWYETRTVNYRLDKMVEKRGWSKERMIDFDGLVRMVYYKP